MGLALPVYYSLDFGWTYVLVILLQFLAGLDVKFKDK